MMNPTVEKIVTAAGESGAVMAKNPAWQHAFKDCMETDRYGLLNRVSECIKYATENVTLMDPTHAAWIYGFVLILALSMVFFGHCYKKMLYFAIGAIPIFFLASTFKADASQGLFTLVDDSASFWTRHFETLFLIFTCVIAAIVGFLAMCCNKLALAVVGGTLSGMLAKMCCYWDVMGPWFAGEYISRPTANMISFIIFILIGALIMVLFFEKVFRSVVPLIGGVFAADSFCCLMVWFSMKFHWVWMQERIFKPTSSLVLRYTVQKLDNKDILDTNIAKVWDAVAKDSAHGIVGSADQIVKDVSEGSDPSLWSNIPIWILWLVLAIALFFVGHSKMKKADLEEEREAGACVKRGSV